MVRIEINQNIFEDPLIFYVELQARQTFPVKYLSTSPLERVNIYHPKRMNPHDIDSFTSALLCVYLSVVNVTEHF